MTRRQPDNREERTIPTPRLDEQSASRGVGMPANADDRPTGVVGDRSVTSGQSRSGEDTRKRGWFWHWNSIVTQFAPIIGLKGVGLLNSYTVWTDRREDSRHRGYAFPSQQSEAAFYGEDRNELITINKLLVALDLIEIRKEMVPRTDAKGRRWKVPHNLYRVKDHGDNFNLTTDDVMRVAHLAEKDRAVYRYVRRIFSPKFSPIDRDNTWHQILDEVRPTDVWQRLAARTERDENRASARSKAGHANRRAADDTAAFSSPNSGDTPASEATAPATNNDSKTGDTNDSASVSDTTVAGTNNGSGASAAQGNTGLGANPSSTAAPGNNGGPTSVAPTSTTYNQELTTTTTEELKKDSGDDDAIKDFADREIRPGSPPDDSRDEEMTVRLFDEANDRPTSAAARRHLRRIADECADLAQAVGVSGWTLVGSAIDEAVASGSAFVAPKRVREIITRWSRDGVPGMYASAPTLGDDPSQAGALSVTGEAGVSHRSVRRVSLPTGDDAGSVWEATCQSLASSIPRAAVESLRSGVEIARYDAGEVTLEAASDELAEDIRNEWQQQIQRKLSVSLRRPVRIVVIVGNPDGPDDDPDGAPEPVKARKESRSPGRTPVPPPAGRRPLPVFRLVECGMTNTQVWTSVLDDLRNSGSIPRAEVDTWLRDSALIGRDEGRDLLIVGVPHTLAERRAKRFLSALETATMHIVGYDCAIEIVCTQEWLAALDDATGTEG